MVLGVAVNVIKEVPPAQIGLVPLTAIETVGVGLTVKIKVSETNGHERLPCVVVLFKIKLIVPDVITGVYTVVKLSFGTKLPDAAVHRTLFT